MQEQTIFVSEDGERFDSKEDCLEWERLKPIIDDTFFEFDEQDYTHEVAYWEVFLSAKDVEKGCVYPFAEWLTGPIRGSEKLKRARGLRELSKKFWPLDTLGPSSN